MSMLPDFGPTIRSFTVDRNAAFAAMGTTIVLAILAATTYILLKGIEAKWRSSEFGE